MKILVGAVTRISEDIVVRVEIAQVATFTRVMYHCILDCFKKQTFSKLIPSTN